MWTRGRLWNGTCQCPSPDARSTRDAWDLRLVHLSHCWRCKINDMRSRCISIYKIRYISKWGSMAVIFCGEMLQRFSSDSGRVYRSPENNGTPQYILRGIFDRDHRHCFAEVGEPRHGNSFGQRCAALPRLTKTRRKYHKPSHRKHKHSHSNLYLQLSQEASLLSISVPWILKSYMSI